MTRRRNVIGFAVTAATLMLVIPLSSSGGQSSATARMVQVPRGAYQPLYGNAGARPLEVKTFRLDRDAVTRRSYLEFVQSHSEWQRSAVAAVKADRSGYLRDWADDLDPGDSIPLDAPVTNVSWFAARAYCSAQGKRLPTVAEWEYVAAASHKSRDAARDPGFIQGLMEWYQARGQLLQPVANADANLYGVRGMHDRVSEWVEDFNSVLVSDDSRGVGAREHDLYCASAAIGAVDPSNYPAFLRYALRAGLNGRSTIQTLGFRCAS